MFINNISLENYNAKLLERRILPSDILIDTFWGDNSLIPFVSEKTKHRYKTLILRIELKGTPSEIEINKSKLLHDIEISTIKFGKLDNSYKGHIAGSNIAKQVLGFEVIQINILAIERGPQIIIDVESDDIIILSSTSDTPVILEITPNENINELEITGFGEDITLYDLTENVKVVIDGESGLVIENGVNKFPDYDSWGFPKLTPGDNLIYIDGNINLTVIYSPRWL